MKESRVFRALGAQDRPAASDYAECSSRVAERAKKLGKYRWEWVSVVLEACARGIHNEVTMGLQVNVDCLHAFTTDDSIEHVNQLTWADVPRWLARCKGEASLRFCSWHGDD